MRHLEVKLLFLQECVQKGLLNVGKVHGATNVADVLTKYLGIDRLVALCTPHGVVVSVGPAGGARGAEGGCEPKCSRTPVGETCFSGLSRATPSPFSPERYAVCSADRSKTSLHGSGALELVYREVV